MRSSDSGLEMWRTVHERMSTIQTTNPQLSDLSCMQQVMQGILREYKDAEALVDTRGTKGARSEGRPKLKIRANRLEEDEDSDATVASQRAYILQLQKSVNDAADRDREQLRARSVHTAAVPPRETREANSSRSGRGGTHRGSHGRGRGTYRGSQGGHQTNGNGSATASGDGDKCAQCGLQHFTRNSPCAHFINGVYSLESLADYIAKGRTPAALMDSVFDRVWPNSIANRDRTETDREKVRQLVAERLHSAFRG